MNYCACGCGNYVRRTWHKGHNRRGVPPTNKIGFTISHGYVFIWKPDHHRARKDTGYVKRCIIMAEKSINRDLLPGECVHHINGIKDDDRPENLKVLTKSKHDKITVFVSELCQYPGCIRSHKARGLCGVHYGEYYNSGTPMPLAATRRNRWKRTNV